MADKKPDKQPTDHERALDFVLGYIRDKGLTVGALDGGNGHEFLVTKAHCMVAEILYDPLIQSLTLKKLFGPARTIFLLHPMILATIDLLFDPPPPVCDPDR